MSASTVVETDDLGSYSGGANFDAGQVYGQSQAITATLSGTVLDPTGQTVSGSKVTLLSPNAESLGPM